MALVLALPISALLPVRSRWWRWILLEFFHKINFMGRGHAKGHACFPTMMSNGEIALSDDIHSDEYIKISGKTLSFCDLNEKKSGFIR